MLCLLVPDEDDERHGDGGHGQGRLHTVHAPEFYLTLSTKAGFRSIFQSALRGVQQKGLQGQEFSGMGAS